MDQVIKDKELYRIIAGFCFGEPWANLLVSEVEKEYFQKLFEKLDEEYKTKTILPDKRDVFRPFKATVPSDIKIVIVGEFPVGDSSSVEIFKKAIPRPLKQEILKHIYLINTILTVDASNYDLHRNIGWEQLIKESLSWLVNKQSTILFVFVGKYANIMHSELTIPKDNKHIFMNIDSSDIVPNDLGRIIEETLLESNIKLSYIDEEGQSTGNSNTGTTEQT